MTPHEYCRAKAAPDGSSLHYSLLFLDKPRQQAITAIHAFHHEVADIVRTGIDAAPAHARLEWWRQEIGELFERRPTHPITQALAETLEPFPITSTAFLGIIDTIDMDLHEGRYPDFVSLQRYCRHGSGAVNALTSEILGARHQSTVQSARDLGVAGRIAEIVCNVGLDARHGRIYLPLEDFQRFGVSDDDIFNARYSSGFADLIAYQAQRANNLRESALSNLTTEDRKAQRAILSLAAMQFALLDEICRDNYRILDQNFSLTPLRRFWIACRIWARG